MRLKIPPAIVFLVHLLLVWLVAEYLPHTQIEVPGRLALVQVIGTAGVVLGVVAAGLFRRAGTTLDPVGVEKASKIVDSGLYRFTRNPMYLGLTLILIAWIIWKSNGLGILGVISFVWYITEFQIKPEEEALTEKFGEEYEQYRRRVRRWI